MPRGRKPLIRPTRSLHLHIDAELADTMDQFLYSEAELRVPKGAYQMLVTEAIVRLLKQQPLDLSPWAGSIPSEHVVYAYPGTKEVLTQLLNKDKE